MKEIQKKHGKHEKIHDSEDSSFDNKQRQKKSSKEPLLNSGQ